MTNLWLRLRALLRRRELDRDLEEELSHHLEMKRRVLAEDGAAPEDAHTAARRGLGNATYWREETREVWRFRYLESLWMDVGYALRLLAKDRVFTLVALITLTLGIGANTAIFSLLNGLFWRPLPVERPEEIVRIALTNIPPTYMEWIGGRPVKPTEFQSASFPLYEALARRQGVFSTVFGTAGRGAMQVEIDGVPRRAAVDTVTGSYFPALELKPAAGRLLDPGDDVAGGPSTGWSAVISDAAWSGMFARSPRAIGARITIERVPFTIAGVAPPSFRGTNPAAETGIWVPMSAMEAMFPDFHWRNNRGFSILQPMARLKPGVTIEQAAQHLAAISRPVLEEAKELHLRGKDEEHFLAMKLEPRAAGAGQSWVTRSFREPLWILMAAVLAVLLIAATNLTNLLLARSTARSQEVAVRLSLGAPVSRIRRQFIVESALLAGGGVVAGLLWANWLVDALQQAASREGSAIRIDTSLDWRIFAFLAAALIVTVVVAGVAPAFSAARVAPQQVLKRHSRATASTRLRRGLIVFQTALSLTLLVGAGLMIGTLQRIAVENTGFRNDQLVFLTPDLYNAGISRERMPRAYENLLTEIRSQPGIAAAAWTRNVPLMGSLNSTTVDIPGRNDLDVKQRMVFVHFISDGYFPSLGIPLLDGSDFGPGPARRGLCVISESAARRFFGSPSGALGARLKLRGEWLEIGGVVADAKYHNIREAAPPTVYLRHQDGPGMAMAIRYRGSQEQVVATAQRLFRQEAGRVPFVDVRTVEGSITNSLRVERLISWLLAGFAAFAMLISATGLAGLLSYSVERRRKEIGVRIALGATPSRVRRHIQLQGLALASGGIVLGLVLSYLLRRSLDSFLFGVAPTDPRVWAAGVATLLLAALAATAIPAWRAARIDPVAMLRDQ